MKLISFIQQVTDDLYHIEGEAGAVFPYCHAYLLNKTNLILFDPQCGRNRLKEALKQLGKRYTDIKIIINTHFHADHTCSNSFLKKKSGAKILIHEADRIAVESIDEYINRYGMTDKKIAQLWRNTLAMIGFKASNVDETFKDGDILPEGFQVIHTPGHAPGHCCFFKSGTLISGDIDLTSPWVGNITSNVADYLQSIEKLLQFRIHKLFPAHGMPIFDDIPSKLKSFRDKIFQREQKIYEALPKKPITVSELTERIFNALRSKNRAIEERQAFFTLHFAKINNLNYLIHLESLGKVQRFIRNTQEFWQKIE